MENFLQTDYKLLSNTSIDLLNKLIISRALSFQNNNLKYYESNSSIAEAFGVTKDKVIYQLKVLKKLPFVTFNTITNFENKGKTRFIIINQEDLTKFLNKKVEKVEKVAKVIAPKKEVKPLDTPKITEKHIEDTRDRKLLNNFNTYLLVDEDLMDYYYDNIINKKRLLSKLKENKYDSMFNNWIRSHKQGHEMFINKK